MTQTSWHQVPVDFQELCQPLLGHGLETSSASLLSTRSKSSSVRDLVLKGQETLWWIPPELDARDLGPFLDNMHSLWMDVNYKNSSPTH